MKKKDSFRGRRLTRRTAPSLRASRYVMGPTNRETWGSLLHNWRLRHGFYAAFYAGPSFRCISPRRFVLTHDNCGANVPGNYSPFRVFGEDVSSRVSEQVFRAFLAFSRSPISLYNSGLVFISVVSATLARPSPCQCKAKSSPSRAGHQELVLRPQSSSHLAVQRSVSRMSIPPLLKLPQLSSQNSKFLLLPPK